MAWAFPRLERLYHYLSLSVFVNYKKPYFGATVCRAIGGGTEHWQWLDRGSMQNLVKRRLKQTGACWRVPRVNRIAVIGSALYSEQWDDCWKKYH